MVPPPASEAFRSVEQIRRSYVDWRTLGFLGVNFVLAAGYIGRAYRTAAVRPELRSSWMVLLRSAGLIALPVYCAHFIVSKPGRERIADRRCL